MVSRRSYTIFIQYTYSRYYAILYAIQAIYLAFTHLLLRYFAQLSKSLLPKSRISTPGKLVYIDYQYRDKSPPNIQKLPPANLLSSKKGSRVREFRQPECTPPVAE